MMWSARQPDAESERPLFASRVNGAFCLQVARMVVVATILASKPSIARLEAAVSIDGGALLRALGLANNGSLKPFGRQLA
jgi:hypothetical protein